METRTNWVVVVVALVIALGFIGTALAFVSTSTTNANDTTAVEFSAAPEGTNAAWQKSLELFTPTLATGQGEYRAPKELPPTEAIAQELLTTYIQMKQDGTLTPESVQNAVEEIISRNIQEVTPPVIYTAASVTVQQNGDIIPYAGSLTEILARSTEIKEYEMKSFARSIGEHNTKGSATLALDAEIYAGIEHDLKTLRVPQSVVKEHLAVLQSASALAYVTSLMAEWSGEPVHALAFIDAFAKTEREVQLSISALYRRLGVLAQQS